MTKPYAEANRVVLVTHPSADLYGSDRVLLESVIGLVESGWDVVATLPTDGPLLKLLRKQGVRTIICPTPVLRKSVLSPRGFLPFVRNTLLGFSRGIRVMSHERPAIVYVNTITIPLWLVLGRLHKVPTICHVHEAEGTARRMMQVALTAPLFLATQIITNSDFSLGVLTRTFPRLRRRAKVILNGVRGPSDPQPPRSTLDGGVALMYVGRLSPRKGVDVAIDALAELRRTGMDVSLQVVGAVFPGYEWYERQLRAQAEHAGIAEHVTFLGFQKEVFELVQASDIVVVPSRADEPFGNTAVEAILCERPVIASATSGLLEAISGYRSPRSVPPVDPISLARGVAKVIDDWQQVREDVKSDRLTASIRHAPASYRSSIAREVTRLAERSSPAGHRS